MSPNQLGPDPDPRRQALDLWASEHAERLRAAARSDRWTCSLRCDGRSIIATTDVFHDALGEAYVSLVADLERKPHYGCDGRGPSALAVRGLANRRLYSRIIDIWRAADRTHGRKEPDGDKEYVGARPRPGVRYGRTADYSPDPAPAACDLVAFQRASKELSSSDRRILGLSMLGYAPQELAVVMDISPLAARQRLHRARRRVDAAMAPKEVAHA
jgi:DNA-directed RNA polymerase specialized sigma24 family protein